MKFLLTFLVTILLAVPVCAADKLAEIPTHNITITPGQPWQMIVKFKFKGTAPNKQISNYYLGYVGKGAPLGAGLVARMYAEASTVDPTAVLLSLTGTQTAALNGKDNVWSLVYIPDLGTALLIAKGKVEVKL